MNGINKPALHGGTITVNVWKLRPVNQPFAADRVILRGVAVRTMLIVHPLDPEMSVETVEIEVEVIVRRGETSALRLNTEVGLGLPWTLEITLNHGHFIALFEEIKKREPSEAELPHGPSEVDLSMTGHLTVSAKPVDGRLVLTAFAEDVVIFGWREEFGYYSDDAGSSGDDGAPAAISKEVALPKAVAAPPSVTVPASVPSVTAVVRGILDTPKQTPDGPPSCPRCNKPMKVKTAFRGRNAGGQFWGCYDYPGCKGTRDINRH